MSQFFKAIVKKNITRKDAKSQRIKTNKDCSGLLKTKRKNSANNK